MVRLVGSRLWTGTSLCAVSAAALINIACASAGYAQSEAAHGARWSAPVDYYADGRLAPSRRSVIRTGDHLRDRSWRDRFRLGSRSRPPAAITTPDITAAPSIAVRTEALSAPAINASASTTADIGSFEIAENRSTRMRSASRSGSRAARRAARRSAPGVDGRARPRGVPVSDGMDWAIMTPADLAARRYPNAPAGAGVMAAVATAPRAGAAAVRATPAIARSDDRAACHRVSSSRAHRKIGRPYQIRGVWYVPARDDDYNETGVASWYGPGFHGRHTANGEVYDQHALTAAHPTLPLPSYVRVRNLENGREVTVRVNDRGPYANDRIIDLSRGAASRLGMLENGTARVRVEFVSDAPLPQEMNASDCGRRPDARPSTNSGSGPARLINASASARESVYRPPAPPRAEPRTSNRAAAGVTVQVGAFSTRERADAVAARFGELPAYVRSADINGRTLYRVFVGPLGSWREAEEAQRMAARLGLGDARVVSSR